MDKHRVGMIYSLVLESQFCSATPVSWEALVCVWGGVLDPNELNMGSGEAVQNVLGAKHPVERTPPTHISP